MDPTITEGIPMAVKNRPITRHEKRSNMIVNNSFLTQVSIDIPVTHTTTHTNSQYCVLQRTGTYVLLKSAYCISNI